MDEMQKDDEFSQWFSTYGVITAERILGTYNITIPSSELLTAIKSHTSFYHYLLQVPLKNVLNGIIFQQGHDYHVYAQKLFIDYLLSGETAKGEGEQGASTREELETERQNLVTLGEEFHVKQLEHEALISSSQANSIKLAKAWLILFESTLTQINNLLKNNNLDVKKSVIRDALNQGLIHCDIRLLDNSESKEEFIKKLNEILKVSLTPEMQEHLINSLAEFLKFTLEFYSTITEYLVRTNEMSEIAKAYRSQFYNTIIRVIELIRVLPDYKIDPVQDEINRETLHFDKTIGE